MLADVADDAAVGRMVQQAVAAFGGLDIVVSNVGIRKMRPFLEITPEEWDEVLRSNLSASFYLARHAIPHMRAKQWGRIIVISGADGFWGHVTLRAANITAKQGMHGLAKAIAREFGADGITANTVSPGPIDTVRDWSQYVHQPRERITAEVPLGRLRPCGRDRRRLPVPGQRGGRLRVRPGDPRQRRAQHVLRRWASDGSAVSC